MVLPKIRSHWILVTVVLAPWSLVPLTIEGRLPGDLFREDNPPRFGAIMSLHSTADSLIVLHAVNHGSSYTVAQQLTKIAKGFKVSPKALDKIGVLEGNMRWLQYSFRKKTGGGFVYITRSQDTIIYLVVFNLQYDALSRDLPYVDRYLKILRITD